MTAIVALPPVGASHATLPTPGTVVPFRHDWDTDYEAHTAALPPALRWHAERQEAHFVRRVRERYGIEVSPFRYRRWIRKVEDVEEGTVFLRQGHTGERTLWEIRFGNAPLHVLFDETTRRLVTCYTPPFEREFSRKGWRRVRRVMSVEADYVALRRRLKAA